MAVVLTARDLTRHYEVSRGLFKGHATVRALNGVSFELEAGKTVVKHGVTLVGETNLPALVAADASSLYARNVLDFLKLVITKEGTLKVDLEDDIVAACLMTHNGEVRRK